VEEAVAALRERLKFSTQAVGSYTVVCVGGCDNPDTIPWLGLFLAGVVAQMVAIDLRLVSYLSAGLDGQAELKRDLDELLGAEGEPLSDHHRTHQRDPWMGEALGHLLLKLSDEAPHPCFPAPAIAAIPPHVQAKDKGLDMFGLLYPEFAVALGEVKTSKENIADLLLKAEAGLKAIKDGERDARLRRDAHALSLATPEQVRPHVVGAFWKRSSCLVALLCYEDDIDLEVVRGGLDELADEGVDCRLIALQHPDHDRFMSDIAAAMRTAVEHVCPT
jgi:hypothetical protein